MAQEIRRILVDHARRRVAQRHGGGLVKTALPEGLDIAARVDPNSDEREQSLLALEKALVNLAKVDPRQARVVEMRYFAGQTLEEIAAHLGVSTMTVKRDWRSSRLFLLRELEAT